MKKILVLGSTGQIGTALKNDLTKWCEVTFFNRNDLDFANIEPLNTKLKDLKPDFIINSAAYTNVDHAEEFIDKAFQVNSLAVEKLSKLANSIGAVLVHFSTDYVFDGKKNTPYAETEMPYPLSIYGKSKLEGEQFIEKNCSKFLILRTSGVISKNNDNFVSKIKKLAKTKKELSVINDQITTVNFSSYISKATSKIIQKIENNPDNENRWGIYHMSGSEPGSWFDFATYAQKMNKLSDPSSSFSQMKISPISSREFNQKAKRPKYSFLASDKLKIDFGISLPNWKKSISEVIG
tara:strand:+ start:155 stop:1036 length:882 start_codon:yes stop_codon:yes gene_type:complete